MSHATFSTLLFVFILSIGTNLSIAQTTEPEIIIAANDSCHFFYNTKPFDKPHSFCRTSTFGPVCFGNSKLIEGDSIILYSYFAVKFDQLPNFLVRISRTAFKRESDKNDNIFFDLLSDDPSIVTGAADTLTHFDTNKFTADSLFKHEQNYWISKGQLHRK
jgi:hypothetical protein